MDIILDIHKYTYWYQATHKYVSGKGNGKKTLSQQMTQTATPDPTPQEC